MLAEIPPLYTSLSWLVLLLLLLPPAPSCSLLLPPAPGLALRPLCCPAATFPPSGRCDSFSKQSRTASPGEDADQGGQRPASESPPPPPPRPVALLLRLPLLPSPLSAAGCPRRASVYLLAPSSRRQNARTRARTSIISLACVPAAKWQDASGGGSRSGYDASCHSVPHGWCPQPPPPAPPSTPPDSTAHHCVAVVLSPR
jgi:hypothetical protein